MNCSLEFDLGEQREACASCVASNEVRQTRSSVCVGSTARSPLRWANCSLMIEKSAFCQPNQRCEPSRHLVRAISKLCALHTSRAPWNTRSHSMKTRTTGQAVRRQSALASHRRSRSAPRWSPTVLVVHRYDIDCHSLRRSAQERIHPRSSQNKCRSWIDGSLLSRIHSRPLTLAGCRYASPSGAGATGTRVGLSVWGAEGRRP